MKSLGNAVFIREKGPRSGDGGYEGNSSREPEVLTAG
jgi:hypothetical protein